MADYGRSRSLRRAEFRGLPTVDQSPRGLSAILLYAAVKYLSVRWLSSRFDDKFPHAQTSFRRTRRTEAYFGQCRVCPVARDRPCCRSFTNVHSTGKKGCGNYPRQCQAVALLDLRASADISPRIRQARRKEEAKMQPKYPPIERFSQLEVRGRPRSWI